jgi:hypothetical protein
MPTLLLTVVLVAAVVSLYYRRWTRRRLRRAARQRLGSSAETAIAIRTFTEMDEHLARRWCGCGGYLERRGEGSCTVAGRQLRVARFNCQECGDDDAVYFDTTDILQ